MSWWSDLFEPKPEPPDPDYGYPSPITAYRLVEQLNIYTPTKRRDGNDPKFTPVKVQRDRHDGSADEYDIAYVEYNDSTEQIILTLRELRA